jgi:hypothetical protein
MTDDESPAKTRSASEARMRLVTVGAVEPPLDVPIRLASYDPQWPARYEILAGQIRMRSGQRR